MKENKQIENNKEVWGNTDTPTESGATQVTGGKIHKEQKSKPTPSRKGKVIKKSKGFVNDQLRGFGKLGKPSKQELSYFLFPEFLTSGKTEYEISVGFDLTAPQQKMVDAIFTMLNELSNNNTRNLEEDYYLGNSEEVYWLTEKTTKIPNTQEERMAVLDTTEKEIAQKYWNKRSVTGREIEVANNVLESIAKKNFVTTIKLKSGEEGLTYLPLFRVAKGKKSGWVLLIAHPLLTRNIGTNYIKYPSDLIQRLQERHQGTLPAGTATFAQYLIRAVSNKKKHLQIKLEKLCTMLAEDKMKIRHISEAIAKTYQALQEFKEEGMLEEYTPNNATSLEELITLAIDTDYIKNYLKEE